MIEYKEFEEIVVNVLKRDISSNEDQKLAISSSKDQSLFIVAGPGSGKTTVMVLKILKFIFVDDVSPKEVLATTFTKKTANELLSRILSWGDKIKSQLIANYMDKMFNGEISDDKIIKDINKIDFNQINIGTIDSVADELLRVHRKSGTSQPILIEDFVANSVMINECLIKDNRYKNEALQEYLAEVSGKESNIEQKPKIKNLTMMADTLIKIKEHIYYNMIDINDILKDLSHKDIGRQIALKLILEYVERLKNQNIYDFAMLETEFLKRLNSDSLSVFLDEIKIILVDEYQDTNLLQESIYFKIAESAQKNGGNITVVGDDDQSLYRFRGASVDLFTNFIERIDKIGIRAKEINLKTNYRSSENIIDLCNDFVELDSEYQLARVKEKPKIEFPQNGEGSIDESNITINKVPVLGMFRKSEQLLANDLAKFVDELNKNGVVKRKIKRVLTKDDNKKFNSNNKDSLINYRDSGFDLAKDEKEIIIELDENGSADDVAFLTYSPKEITSTGSRTFPFILKKHLEKLRNPIEVFNPRGQDLQNIDSVTIFCGLILECIDPDSRYQKTNDKLPNSASRNMTLWRRKANSYINDVNPEPHSPVSLEEFVNHWKIRHPFSSENKENLKWPEKASLMELAYKLVSWIPELQEDDEGVVYLKAITQTIAQTSFFNKYSANIYFSSTKVEKESIDEALLNIFVPIATGGVQIDENYFEVIPSNRFNIMSIHQSKGLEFPLVIVDVGARFKKNLSRDSNLRFPKNPDSSSIIQDRVRKYSSLSTSERDSKDCAFDDLTRLYFVAFSRAKDVLLLVGLNPNIDGYNQNDKHIKIPNVALGWNRDEEFIGFDNIYLI
ncbi:DEAD/DEAH box helicase [Methanobrevibacter olleyae]|uniref:DNA 3'-5' helicase n=1 Tax=Methanobrevibacter olleyae TaxID=294671 RepID=A0A126QYT3_METOL|nr:DEAD/DEAH box helicase [Methanobrevibacter olleyae]AMK15310.1 ATP-dependent DNA helicase UvrD/REP family [Methanobrevibacter olleyae]